MGHLTCSLAMLLWATAAFAADDPADALAKTVLAKAGIHATVCEMPRAGDGTLAAALARAGVAQVHALAPDAHAAEAARKPAAASGVLGSQVIIETGKPDALPLGDWVADLYVVADAVFAKQLKGASRAALAAEAGRVLSPYRGVAVVGNPAGTQSGLTKAALAEWARDTGGTATITEDASGLWAVVKMPRLSGGDDWSHFMHGADGNLVSQDTAFIPGAMALQWAGGPYLGGNFDINVASAGRWFIAQSSLQIQPDQPPRDYPCDLVARSLYNGSVLWRRPIAKDFGECASLVVATPDRLFVKDGNGVLVLQPENGAVIRRLAASTDDHQTCLWMLQSQGVLLTLVGPVQHIPTSERDDIQILPRTPAHLKGLQEINDQFCGQELAAWDIASGQELWRFRERRIVPTDIAVANGHVCLYANENYATCLDLLNGKRLWKTDAPITDPRGPGMSWIDGHLPRKNFLLHRHGGILTKDVYLVSYLPYSHCQAFSATDGHILWRKMLGPTGQTPDQTDVAARTSIFNSPLVLDDKVIGRRAYCDLLTGQGQPPLGFRYGGCGRFTGMASGFLLGQCGEIFDVKQEREVTRLNYKTACGISQFVADGVLIKSQDNVDCGTEWRGPMTIRSRIPHAPRLAPRLEAGEAGLAAIVTGDERDWTTYRNDATRKGASAATIPGHAAVRWTYTPARASDGDLVQRGEYLADANASQAIAVDNLVWFGQADGSVICLDRLTGAERWRQWTAGRIIGAPTWWRGRLYVGSCDGWVYCLDATSGKMAWRYRVAPEERRIMIWGSLASVWPVMGNVLVTDGVVYAGAGMMGQVDGLILVALDAQSGTLKWEQRFNQGNDAPTMAGQLAVSQGKLWWHVGSSGVLVIDPSTGVSRSYLHAADDSRQEQQALDYAWHLGAGQDIGILPGGWIACGGRFYNSPLNAPRMRDTSWGLFSKINLGDGSKDDAVRPKLFDLLTLHRTESIPVWDAKGILLFGRNSEWHTPAVSPVLISSLDSLSLRMDATSKQRIKFLEQNPTLTAGQNLLPPLSSLITPKPAYIWKTPILANNAIVILTCEWYWTDKHGPHVTCLNRENGKEMWKVELPALPVIGGMSLTGAGDVLLPLADGRVICIGAKE